MRKSKLIFWFSLIVVILLALIMAQSAKGEEAPEYGRCTIFAWAPSRIWFTWHSAPAGVVRFEDTIILTNMRTGQDFVTGSTYAPLYIVDDAYILFEGVDFLSGNWRISNLTCIARYASGMTTTTTQDIMKERALYVLKDLKIEDEKIDAFLREVPMATHNQRGRGFLCIEIDDDQHVKLERLSGSSRTR